MVYDFKKVETEVLDYWNKNTIYPKLKARNKGKQYFYFLDGPPYTSGKVHIGTAWNKSLKDMVLRYKRMNGFDVWDRAGYDMHGLPTENAAQKKLGIKSKDAILKFGMDKFIQECKTVSVDNLNMMNEDFKRIGVWMDFKNAYQSIKKEFIEAEWWLIKKAHENGRLYEGLRTMTWCPSCETALAKHELEYQTVTEDSIFLKFKLKEKNNEYLIIWTTTPWTIPFNMAVMVNPDVEYVKVKVDNEYWYLAKALAGIVVQAVAGKKLEIVKEMKGEDLEGLKYVQPLYDELPEIYSEFEKKSKKAFSVILSSEYVDTSGGSGLVHAGPGCGPEDFEVCYKNGIPPFNNLDERGVFPKEMGIIAGFVAKKNDKKFIQIFKDKGILIETTQVEHEYAHCQRCHNPVIFRVTKQWFFKVEDLKQKMVEENKKVYWVPNAAFNAFDSWLKNLRDNSITKQRFWGTPLPVWRCDSCNDYLVIGTEDELVRLSGKKPKDLHKPWIDEIEIKCLCGGVKRRIPDIVDVWVDAGTASWNCLDYPNNKELFNKMFPADFILEGKDQIRGWFNLLMVASTLAFDKNSFKSVYMHGFVQDSQGRKMSKSLGNYILPEEVIKDYGADTLRYYMIGGANPGIDINYNFEDMKIKFRNLDILWNLTTYLIELAQQNKFEIGKEPKSLGVEEKYILSKLNSTIETVTNNFEDYKLNEIPWRIEELYLELSRTYVQMIRDKSSVGSDAEKFEVFYTLHKVLLESLKMFSTVSPFITEYLYLKLKVALNHGEESIHLCAWPKADKKMINTDLEASFDLLKRIVQAGLAARAREGINVRWPLKSIKIFVNDSDKLLTKEVKEVIKRQVNVKEVLVEVIKKSVEEIVQDGFGSGYVKLDTVMTKELEEEGYAREISRKIQEARKNVGLRKIDFVDVVIESEFRLNKELIEDLKVKCGAKKLEFGKSPKDFEKSSEFKIKDKDFKLYFTKFYLE